MYASLDFYTNQYKGTTIDSDNVESYLERASLDIDGLTYNRIEAQGFSKLTAYQQDRIMRAECAQADFLFLNGDSALDSLRNPDQLSLGKLDMSFSEASDPSPETNGLVYRYLITTNLLNKAIDGKFRIYER